MGKFVKENLTMEVNPVCENLFIKQGWKPFKEEPIIAVDSDKEDSVDKQVEDKTDSEIKIYSKRAFNGMSIEKILDIAKERNYVITATDKSEIVEQFLVCQGE